MNGSGEAKMENVVIKVIGVGGGGNNAVGTMAQSNIEEITLIVANTDKQALEQSPAEVKFN